eukprot:SAG22_NODE_673_length_7973_cov_3.643129_8_plen_115_part_00
MPVAAAALPPAVVLPIFFLYTASALAAAVVALVRPLPLPAAGTGGAPPTLLVRSVRAGAVAGLVLLAAGTGLDNARTFAGHFSASVPDGVFVSSTGIRSRICWGPASPCAARAT